MNLIQANVFEKYSPCPGFILHLFKADASLIEKEDDDPVRLEEPNWGLQSVNIVFASGWKRCDPFSDMVGHCDKEVLEAALEARERVWSQIGRAHV